MSESRPPDEARTRHLERATSRLSKAVAFAGEGFTRTSISSLYLRCGEWLRLQDRE